MNTPLCVAAAMSRIPYYSQLAGWKELPQKRKKTITQSLQSSNFLFISSKEPCVKMCENTDQKKLHIWTLFTHWKQKEAKLDL